MKVMLAIDGSEHSNFAVDETADGIWPANSELRILSVVQHSEKEIKDAARELVDQAITRVTHGKAGFASIKGDVIKGYPKKAILTEAENWKPDLLMAGSRGLKGLTRVVLGSVSHALLLGSSCSIRIIRRHSKADCEHAPRVVVALDESDYSKHALEQIAKRPWQEGTSFCCVMAVPTLTQLMHDEQVCFSFDKVKEEHDTKVESAKIYLERMSKSLAPKLSKGMEVLTEVIDGDPRESLVEKANDWHADLIVMGCKGKNLMDRLVIGSVSEAVVTWASCSVEVIKR